MLLGMEMECAKARTAMDHYTMVKRGYNHNVFPGDKSNMTRDMSSRGEVSAGTSLSDAEKIRRADYAKSNKDYQHLITENKSRITALTRLSESTANPMQKRLLGRVGEYLEKCNVTWSESCSEDATPEQKIHHIKA